MFMPIAHVISKPSHFVFVYFVRPRIYFWIQIDKLYTGDNWCSPVDVWRKQKKGRPTTGLSLPKALVFVFSPDHLHT